MVGRLAGFIVALALLGSLLVVSQPSLAERGSCGPVTLDRIFPGLGPDGQATPTTWPTPTTLPASTTTTTSGETSTTTPAETTTTSQTVTPEPGPSTSTTPAPPTTAVCRTWTYDLDWPLAVESYVGSVFGVDRDGGARRHKGADIAAPKLTPVVAAAGGVVSSIQNEPDEDCCWLTITHPDGWQTWYLHLNNDTYLTDDGAGMGVRRDLVVGAEVARGEVIGWVGDSGNAEDAVPHLHFELRNPQGYAVDAVPSLKAALGNATFIQFVGPYRDDEGTDLEPILGMLASQGIWWACDESGTDFCPGVVADADTLEVLITRMTGMPAPTVDDHDQEILLRSFIADSDLTAVIGCNLDSTCLQSGITEGELARLVQWAFEIADLLANEVEVDPDIELLDVDKAEESLRARGAIGTCEVKLDNRRVITRSEAVTLLSRLLAVKGQSSCLTPLEPIRSE